MVKKRKFGMANSIMIKRKLLKKVLAEQAKEFFELKKLSAHGMLPRNVEFPASPIICLNPMTPYSPILLFGKSMRTNNRTLF